MLLAKERMPYKTFRVSTWTIIITNGFQSKEDHEKGQIGFREEKSRGSVFEVVGLGEVVKRGKIIQSWRQRN